ncbi:MAG: hypothetical protein QW728_04495 [Thermoplasmata archaeon]
MLFGLIFAITTLLPDGAKADEWERTCIVTATPYKEIYNAGETVELLVYFYNMTTPTDPTNFTITSTLDSTEQNITSSFTKVSDGVYKSTFTIPNSSDDDVSIIARWYYGTSLWQYAYDSLSLDIRKSEDSIDGMFLVTGGSLMPFSTETTYYKKGDNLVITAAFYNEAEVINPTTVGVYIGETRSTAVMADGIKNSDGTYTFYYNITADSQHNGSIHIYCEVTWNGKTYYENSTIAEPADDFSGYSLVAHVKNHNPADNSLDLEMMAFNYDRTPVSGLNINITSSLYTKTFNDSYSIATDSTGKGTVHIIYNSTAVTRTGGYFYFNAEYLYEGKYKVDFFSLKIIDPSKKTPVPSWGDFEIEVRPVEVKNGDTLTVYVFNDSQPYAGKEVHVIYYSDSKVYYTGTKTTDSGGRFQIQVQKDATDNGYYMSIKVFVDKYNSDEESFSVDSILNYNKASFIGISVENFKAGQNSKFRIASDKMLIRAICRFLPCEFETPSLVGDIVLSNNEIWSFNSNYDKIFLLEFMLVSSPREIVISLPTVFSSLKPSVVVYGLTQEDLQTYYMQGRFCISYNILTFKEGDTKAVGSLEEKPTGLFSCCGLLMAAILQCLISLSGALYIRQRFL